MTRGASEKGTRPRVGRGVSTQRAGSEERSANTSHTILANDVRIHLREKE